MATPLSSWIPLSTQSSYPGVDALIVSLMGRKEIDVLVLEEPGRNEVQPYRCKAVVAASQRFGEEDRACLDAGFEERTVRAFQGAGYSLWRVPALGCAILNKPLTAGEMRDRSIVRYKTAQFWGCAFHVQGYLEDFDHKKCGWHSKVQSLKGVVEMFTRGREWGMTSSPVDLIEKIQEVYLSEPRFRLHPEIPAVTPEIRGSGNEYRFIVRILSGTDPVLRLVGEVPQIEQPLPAKAPS